MDVAPVANVFLLLLIVVGFVVVAAGSFLLVYLAVQVSRLGARVRDLEHAVRRLLDDRPPGRPYDPQEGSTGIQERRI